MCVFGVDVSVATVSHKLLLAAHAIPFEIIDGEATWTSASARRTAEGEAARSMSLVIINSFRATNDIGAAVNRYFPGLNARSSSAKKKQIYKWERQRVTIEERISSVATTHGRRQRATGVGTTPRRDTERELSEWISDLRKKGIPVSAKILELRALEMARELDIPVGAFVASWH
ncbi:hypothetical protein PybrP1_010266 [[Pythium] brassicae (nom. inval.)]|nr:hypothetical protein PybrP1_010266 [[Pythium] brassicae (nom. inval.)]